MRRKWKKVQDLLDDLKPNLDLRPRERLEEAINDFAAGLEMLRDKLASKTRRRTLTPQEAYKQLVLGKIDQRLREAEKDFDFSAFDRKAWDQLELLMAQRINSLAAAHTTKTGVSPTVIPDSFLDKAFNDAVKEFKLSSKW